MRPFLWRNWGESRQTCLRIPISVLRDQSRNFRNASQGGDFRYRTRKVGPQGEFSHTRWPVVLVNQHSWHNISLHTCVINDDNGEPGSNQQTPTRISSPVPFYPLRQDGLRQPFSEMGNTHFHLWRKPGSVTWPLWTAWCTTTNFLHVFNYSN
jgi:hypothetical protein